MEQSDKCRQSFYTSTPRCKAYFAALCLHWIIDIPCTLAEEEIRHGSIQITSEIKEKLIKKKISKIKKGRRKPWGTHLAYKWMGEKETSLQLVHPTAWQYFLWPVWPDVIVHLSPAPTFTSKPNHHSYLEHTLSIFFFLSVIFSFLVFEWGSEKLQFKIAHRQIDMAIKCLLTLVIFETVMVWSIWLVSRSRSRSCVFPIGLST